MLNYEVERSALAERVPRGTELDEWEGHTYLSVVGFLFLNTRVLGVPIPFHRDFEEVNLRFYVRHKSDEGWRRGVVFVKELVPRAAIALVARALYNENYAAVPMGHELRRSPDGQRVESVSYRWRSAGREDRLSVAVASEPAPLRPGSHEEFIVAPAIDTALDCDAERLYGEPLGRLLQGQPASAFLADGSDVTVSHGARLAGVP
jgi:uncharacterized protein YqjF (DUF2071 family)